MADMAMINVALVGAGRVASLHADGFLRTGCARIVAVADPREDAATVLADRLGAESVPDLEAVLGLADVDAVCLAVPHDLHAPMAMKVLMAGRHVFLDKPLATTVEDGEAVAQLAARSQPSLMVCHNLLFHPAVRLASARLAERPVGRITTVAAWSHGWLDLTPWDFRRSLRSTGGGAWVDGAGHLLYTIEHLLGPVDHVQALRATGESRIGGEDNASAVIGLRSGATGTLQVSYADRLAGSRAPWPAGWRLGLRISGTAGTLELDLLPEARLATSRDGAPVATERVDASFEASFHAAIAEFVRAVVEHREPSISAKDALRILRLLHDAA